jgi:hypothetical protein
LYLLHQQRGLFLEVEGSVANVLVGFEKGGVDIDAAELCKLFVDSA